MQLIPSETSAPKPHHNGLMFCMEHLGLYKVCSESIQREQLAQLQSNLEANKEEYFFAYVSNY